MSIASYRNALRSAVRGRWNGALTTKQFIDSMTSAMDRRLTEAWEAGAKQCGILADELSPAERLELGRAIIAETKHISNFELSIDENSKANGGKLSGLLTRVESWVIRYLDITNKAKSMACADKKMVWRLGPTKESCSTCPRLDGKVKRNSVWGGLGLIPQNPPNSLLQCGGWKCLCSLSPTDLPVSKGPLPRVP